MNKVQSFIHLETLAGGAFAEKINEALMEVAENIQNPNTDPTQQRSITVNIKFRPHKTRQIAGTQISVTTKLAATEAIDTQMIMGVNMRTGKIEIAEYDGQIQGQMSIGDIPDPEPVEETDALPWDRGGKPLDLRNRSRRQEYVPEDQNATGAQEPVDRDATAGRVVNLNDKAAKA